MLKIVQANFSGHAAPGYKRYGDSKLAMEFNHSVQNIEAGLFSWLTTRRAHGISLASMPKDTYLAVPDVVACRDPTDIALAFAGASIQREETKRVRVISQTAAALCYYAKSSLLPQRGRFSAPKTVVVMLVDDLLVETRAYAVQYYENTDSLGFTAVGSDVIVSEFSGSVLAVVCLYHALPTNVPPGPYLRHSNSLPMYTRP